MDNFGLTFYVLMWPVIVAVVLIVIGTAFFREWRASRRNGEDLV